MSENSVQTAIYVHRLEGCRPTPLAHYLKALGILRLVAEQADATARGWWAEDVFHLATKLSADDLIRFFGERVQPTPMAAPWLPRSGFSESSSHSKTREFLEEIIQCEDERFDVFREWYTNIRKLAMSECSDLDSPDQLRNHKFISLARSVAPPAVRGWIDSCVISDSDSISYPAVFGSGGNEGSGSYLANFYVAICAVLVRKLDDFQNAIFGRSTYNSELQKFVKANGFNSGHFAESLGEDPSTYFLALEGIVLLKASFSRKWNEHSEASVAGTGASLAAPFSVANSMVGYPSSCNADSVTLRQGAKTPGRGEQWFPLWSRPATVREVNETFRLARCQLMRRRVARSSDFLRSIARNGTNNGITSFARYGYFQRNGGNHMAVPLGVVKVQPRANQKLLDEVATWVDRLGRIANGKNASNSLLRFQRNCEESIVLCTQKPDARSFLALLITTSDAEDQFIRSPKYSADANARPIPRLSHGWIELLLADPALSCDIEFRLALSLSAQFGNLSSREEANEEDRVPMRDFWLPLDRNRVNFLKGERGLAIGPGQCAIGLPLEKALTKIFQRRLHDVDQGKGAQNAPFQLIRNSLGASLEQIQAFINGNVDDAKILSMARALMAIDFRNARDRHTDAAKRDASSNDSTFKREHSPLAGMATYGVMRLAFGGGSKRKGGIRITESNEVHVQADATTFNRLVAGDLNGALARAIRRASISGLRPRIQVAVGAASFARRIAASLCFGVSDSVMTRLALGLTSPTIPLHEPALNESI